MTRDIKWADWKINDPAETLKMIHKANKEYLVPGIEEDIIPISEPEDKMPVHVIPDEGERVRLNGISENSSELTYHNKDSDAETSVYNRVLNSLNIYIYTLYNPTMQKMHKPVIEGNYNVTGYTRVVPIVEN